MRITSGVDLVGGYTTLISFFPGSQGFFVVLSALGVGLIIISIGKWAWDRRKGGSIGGFPVMAVILGIAAAAPGFFIPLVLTVVGALIDLIAPAVTGATSRIKG